MVAALALTSDAFRMVMGRFATGITVVTTFLDEPQGGQQGPGAGSAGGRRPLGITVNALSSVSLEPPIVVVALDRSRRITPVLHAFGRFAVNVLGESQQALSDCFAGAPVTPDREAFCGAAWRPGATGLPLLDGAIATLECTVGETFRAGDHDLFLGRVDAIANDEQHAMPLLFYRRQYLRIERAATSEVEGKTG
jgi:3-hydroxy-9,10-secoandrosta-1,3,5(10)-triene-9,17-dione monooxygenase reductase component